MSSYIKPLHLHYTDLLCIFILFIYYFVFEVALVTLLIWLLDLLLIFIKLETFKETVYPKNIFYFSNI